MDNAPDLGLTPEMMEALQKQAIKLASEYEKEIKNLGRDKMAEMVTPMVTPMLTGGGGDGLFGGGAGGGGLIGGLILGSLLRNGGNLLGNNGGTDVVNLNPQQAQANMSLMAGIGDLKQAVAVASATAETSNATQTGQLTANILNSTTANQIAVGGVKDVVNSNSIALMQQIGALSKDVMENRYELSKDVSNDGEKNTCSNCITIRSYTK